MHQTSIRFHVASRHSYRMVIPEKPIFDEVGEELDGRAVESPPMILISRRVRPSDREAVLLHEIGHAWEFYVPAPTTSEERQQLLAEIGAQYRHDLDVAGGIDALLNLQASRVTLPFDSPATERRADSAKIYRHTDFKFCGACEAPTMCGSYDHGHVEHHGGLDQHQLLMWFTCEVCGALNTWREVATSDGRPTGALVPVPPPRLYYGAAAREWLEENSVALAR